MLAKRLLTAVIGIPLVIFLVRSGSYFFAATIFLLEGIAFFELNGMLAKKNAGIYFSSMFFAFLICIAAFHYNNTSNLFLLFILATLCALLQGIFSHKQKNWHYKSIYSIFALCYIGLFFSLFILLRQYQTDVAIDTTFGSMSKGECYFWLCLIGTWASDTFAYFAGTAFGKHKLCPDISPNKSWEGAIAGFIGCVLSVLLLAKYVFNISDVSSIYASLPGASFSLGIFNFDIIIVSFLIAFFAPLGDLVESQLKRFFAVKDSGSIFPGHGGVLDRLDSLLFVIPAVYAYLNFSF